MSENINDIIKLPVTIEQSDRHYVLRSADSPKFAGFAVTTANKAIAEFVAQAINSFEDNQRRIAELEAVAQLYLDELRSVEKWAASTSMQSQIETRIRQVEKALEKAEGK